MLIRPFLSVTQKGGVLVSMPVLVIIGGQSYPCYSPQLHYINTTIFLLKRRDVALFVSAPSSLLDALTKYGKVFSFSPYGMAPLN